MSRNIFDFVRDSVRNDQLALWTVSRDLAWLNDKAYQDWIVAEQNVQAKAFDYGRIQGRRYRDHPFVSFLLCDDGDDENLRASLESLAAVAATAAPESIEMIVATRPERIRDVEHLAANASVQFKFTLPADAGSYAESEERALTMAQGEFVAFMSPGDRLSPFALKVLLTIVEVSPKVAILYSDEDWLDEQGNRMLPRFKTGWDPDAQSSFDLFGRLCLMRRWDVAKVGGLRTDRAPAHHYDLHCRLSNAVLSAAIRHVPQILYHRKAPPAHLWKQGAAARENYCDRARAIAGEAVSSLLRRPVEVAAAPLAPFLNRVIWPLPNELPLVSILVPTRDRPELLCKCAHGILYETDYSAIELIILDNDSVQPDTVDLLDSLGRDPRVRILKVPGEFNYSKINNVGASQARGQILLFMNSDIEVIASDWLREMVSLALRPDTGCVGAKLIYRDRRIQHAGIVLQNGPLAMHVFRLTNPDHLGFDAQLAGVRSYSAVTAACLAVRRSTFEAVGGFDQDVLKIAFNDLDLCLKVDALGYRNVCTPFATLFHLESASRGSDSTVEQQNQHRFELKCVNARWADRFHRDSFHHPNVKLSWDGGESLVSEPRSFCPAEMSR